MPCRELSFPFIGIYVAVNPDWYQRGLLHLVPPVQRRRAQQILDAIGHTLRWWLFGRVVGMTIVGVVTTVGQCGGYPDARR